MSIQFQRLGFFPKMVEAVIGEDNEQFDIITLSPEPLKFLSLVLKVMNKVYVKNFIYYYMELQVAAI